jgi:putative flippase GtrA
LFVFIEFFNISKYIAPFFGLIITIPLNFILNKLWAFSSVKHKEDRQDEENQHIDSLL